MHFCQLPLRVSGSMFRGCKFYKLVSTVICVSISAVSIAKAALKYVFPRYSFFTLLFPLSVSFPLFCMLQPTPTSPQPHFRVLQRALTSPKPPPLQTEQPQLPQLLTIRLVFQTPHSSVAFLWTYSRACMSFLQ